MGAMEGGRHRLEINGEMTVFTAARQKDELLSALARCETLELVLEGVDEFDSAGLQLLIMVHETAQAQGKTLRLSAPAQAVQEVLMLCGLDALFGLSLEDPR